MRPLEARERREAIKGSVTVWRPWQLKDLELFHVVAASIPSCQHVTQEYLLMSAQSGAVNLQYRKTRFSGQVADGTLQVIEPGETWSCHCKDLTYHTLFLDPAWLQQLATEMIQWEKPLPHFPDQTLFDPSLSRAVRDLAAKSRSPASRLQQEETLLHLFAQLLFSHSEGAGAQPQLSWEHPAIKRAKDYLEAHYTQEVALQELARVARLSPFHLARVFRKVVGLPPHAYQTQLRLAHARKLLAQDFDVSYVAMEMGFCDQSHFTQQFKRLYQVTPGIYRKTARFL
jgi:AraC-like DNA-binding protein